ncbi:type II toxin-antitoxin system Phd/YefM family antitoxin [Acidobacteriota bacterium]
MDKIIGISELRKSLASIVKKVYEEGSRYIILQNSQAKAVLLSPDEMEILEDKTKYAPIKDVKSEGEDNVKKKLSSYEKFFGKK